MDYHIAIVDDETSITQKLDSYCKQFAETEHLSIQTHCFHSGAVFQDYIETHPTSTNPFHLIFLDIEMGDKNGMELAKTLREQGNTACLIFVTNLVQYAIDGYKVDAIDYVLKPVGYDDFAFRIKRAFRHINKLQNGNLNLTIANQTIQINYQELLFVEIQGHLLTYHTTDKVYQTYGSMRSVQQALPPQLFAKPHQSFLVNLSAIKAIKSGNTICIGTTEIPISRMKKQEFLTRFSTYVGGFK